jgi:hypothetical protein
MGTDEPGAHVAPGRIPLGPGVALGQGGPHLDDSVPFHGDIRGLTDRRRRKMEEPNLFNHHHRVPPGIR